MAVDSVHLAIVFWSKVELLAPIFVPENGRQHVFLWEQTVFSPFKSSTDFPRKLCHTK
jgi:hypothetical protein